MLLKHYIFLCCTLVLGTANFHFPMIKDFGAEKTCPSGYVHLKNSCKHKCPYPNYGDGCKHQCHCSEPYCHHKTGCFLAVNCADGYTGESCETPCTFPYFGYGCQQLCLCSKQHCNFSTGCTVKQSDKNIPTLKPRPRTTPVYRRHHFRPLLTYTPKAENRDVNTTMKSATTELIDVKSGLPGNAKMEVDFSKSDATLLPISFPLGKGRTDKIKSSKNKFLSWNRNTWIKISLISLIVALFAMTVLHVILSCLRCAMRKR